MVLGVCDVIHRKHFRMLNKIFTEGCIFCSFCTPILLLACLHDKMTLILRRRQISFRNRFCLHLARQTESDALNSCSILFSSIEALAVMTQRSGSQQLKNDAQIALTNTELAPLEKLQFRYRQN